MCSWLTGMKQFDGQRICILGGGIRRDEQGVWRTLGLQDGGDAHGVTCDRLRVDAAIALYERSDHCAYLVLGGKGQYAHIPNAPAIADVIRTELIEGGIPEAHIETETRSGTTYEQLLALQEYFLSRRILQPHILSNEWHLPRITAMINTISSLVDLARMRPEYLAAEEILLRSDNMRWEPYIRKMYSMPAFAARLEKEKCGVEDILRGTYRFS